LETEVNPKSAIRNPQWDVLDLITSLLNKSLLTRAESSQSEDRFYMLETLREYAAERLVELGEADEAQWRHALYFMELAETASNATWGSDEAARLEDRLEEELPNIRAALTWSTQASSDDRRPTSRPAASQGFPSGSQQPSVTRHPEIALRLAATLGQFWELRGYLSEGRSWLRQALLAGADEASELRAPALLQAARLAMRQRDYAAAQLLLEECRTLFRESGDKESLGKTLNALAVTVTDSDYEQALEIHNESLALHREMGDTSKIASTLHNMSFIKMHQGKWDEAMAFSLEAQEIYRQTDVALGMAYTHYVQGNVASGKGDQEAALAHFQECLDTCRQMKNDFMVAWTLHDMAEALYRQGKYGRAYEMLAEAKTMFTELGDTLGLANALVQMGRDASRQDDYAGAATLYKEALAHAIALDNHLVIGTCLAGFAGIAVAKVQSKSLASSGSEPTPEGEEGARAAGRLFGCAQGLLDASYTSLERRAMTMGMAEARSILGEQAWEDAWREGHAMSVEQAIALATNP
jgi:tetratricopeptide (TPR) repeat protein